MSKNRLLTIVALAMLLGVTACESHFTVTSTLSTPASVLPTSTPLPSLTWTPTAEPSPTPTETPVPTPTVTPTRTPFSTPTPGGAVWRILFKGAPCSEMLNPGCQPFDGTPSYLYTIDSDGTDLKKIEVVPEGSYFVRLTPDGTRLAYIGPDNGLYLTDLDGTNSTKVLDRLVSFEFTPDGEYIYYSIQQIVNDTPGYFETQAVIGRICLDGSENFVLTTLPTLNGAYIRVSPDGEWILAWGESKETITKHLLYLVTTGDGTVHHLYEGNHIGSTRWSMDGTTVQFIEWDREADSCVNVFNTIDLDGHRLSTSTVTGLDNCLARGDWSPDGQEFAFAVSPGPENSQHGLWILSLNSGCWYKILSDYSVSSVRTWSGFPAE